MTDRKILAGILDGIYREALQAVDREYSFHLCEQADEQAKAGLHYGAWCLIAQASFGGSAADASAAYSTQNRRGWDLSTSPCWLRRMYRTAGA